MDRPNPAESSARPNPSPVTSKAPKIAVESSDKFAQAQQSQYTHFQEKNAPDHYDGAYRELGLLGTTVEIISIASRLKKIVIQSGDFGEGFDRKKLMELLKDLGVYATLSMTLTADENWVGD